MLERCSLSQKTINELYRIHDRYSMYEVSFTYDSYLDVTNNQLVHYQKHNDHGAVV